MPSPNPYIDQLYDAFTKLQVGERMEIDLRRLGYSGDGELVIPMYFLQKFADERLTILLRKGGNFIQREAGAAGIYFA